jgi:hypothetical protein
MSTTDDLGDDDAGDDSLSPMLSHFPIIESYLARYSQGERPSLTDVVARHPDRADELREFILAAIAMEAARSDKVESAARSAG